jgi:hypothetical protein
MTEAYLNKSAQKQHASRHDHDSTVVTHKLPKTVNPETGRVRELTVNIPDNRYAYGDDESIAQISEDIVGKHTDSDDLAKAAGESAREQFDQDWDVKRRRERVAAKASKFPKALIEVVTDSSGQITGYTISGTRIDGSGLSVPYQRFISQDEALKAIEMV